MCLVLEGTIYNTTTGWTVVVFLCTLDDQSEGSLLCFIRLSFVVYNDEINK